jgi:SAM-dependent methyltransferase
MALIGGSLAALILNRYDWHDLEAAPGYIGGGKINALFGPEFWAQIRGKTVLDLGCGHGEEAIEMARNGATRVIGVETLERSLTIARENLALSGVQNCEFVARTDEPCDVILSLDSFEHFDHPDRILEEMARLLKPDGRVIASFGYPWYHPRGGHLPLFPWGHLLFSERALMTWRSRFKTDGATRFEECDEGLNQMSIRKFERLISESPLRIESMRTIPIRKLRWMHCRLTREFLTSVVQAVLVQGDFACTKKNLVGLRSAVN